MNRRLLSEVSRLAVPATLQGLVVTVVFFTDRLLLGRYDADALGSMQISGPLLWSIFSVFGAFSVGATAVIGRSVGSGDPERAQRTLTSVLAFAAAVGLMVALLGSMLIPWFTTTIGGPGPETASIRMLASEYMQVIFASAPLNFVFVAAVVCLQADGDTTTPMWLSVVQGFVNLALTWVLMWGYFGLPELGIVGAAIGTACSFGIGFIGVIWVLWRRKGVVHLRGAGAPRLGPLQPVFNVAIPAFGEKALFHTAFVTFAAYVAHLGDQAMAANQALIAIESIGFMASGGFAVAAATLVAQKLGAGAPGEAEACGWMSAGLGVAVLGTVSLLFWFLPAEMLSLFTDDPVLIEIGVPCLRIAAVAQPLMAISDAMAGALRGAGDTRTPMVAALVGPVVLRLGLCWWFAFELEMGLIGIWLGTTADWAMRTILLVAVFKAGRWKSIKV